MFRVGRAIPGLLWGVPNVLRRWRLCQRLVCGDLSAFGAGVVTDSVRLCSGWFPVLLR